MKFETKCVFGVLWVGSFGLLQGSIEPSELEKKELIQKIKRVYSQSSDVGVLNERPRKVSISSNEEVFPNSWLKDQSASIGERESETFQTLAAKKLSLKFQKAECRSRKRWGWQGNCEGREKTRSWETIEAYDRIENLTRSWLERAEIQVDKLPTTGETQIDLWSDDYWKLKYGGISYRYSKGEYFENYKEAVASFVQPDSWVKALSEFNVSSLNQEIESWSPSEKYDLSVNDLDFHLTHEQKGEGSQFVDENGDVEGWMGLCHGWAAAAMMAPKPMRSVELWGPQGTRVKWFPHDIRALTTLAWANGDFMNQFIGNRCNSKQPEVYENGRLKDSDCFDNNPASFHLALGNLIGLAKASFVMDAAYDYQVWNQPIKSYRFTFFNPLNPEEQSNDWSQVAVSYDERFKSKDRFQKPLTRGRRIPSSGAHDDSKIDKIVGVIVNVVYLAEVSPVHGDSVRTDHFIRVSYYYDLELTQKGTGYEITGGEWHSNAHPDFLWVPRKGAVAFHSFEGSSLSYSGHESPSEALVRKAKVASQMGYPLCSVLSKLIEDSSQLNYRCPN